jgi:hypothetical protein
MKTRNSSGVGQKIDLGFNLDTLRIEDLGEDDEANGGYSSAPQGGSSVLAGLKRSTTAADTVSEDPSSGAPLGKVRAETDSTKLRQFLNNLDGDE